MRCQGVNKLWNYVLSLSRKLEILLESACWCVLIFCSKFHWQLHLWWCPSGGRFKSVWGQSGSVHQWPVGDSVSWWLGQWWCRCGLQTAGICIHWKWVQVLLWCELTFSFKLLYCGSGGTPYNSAHFGAGTGPIYLDDVACSSSANQLLECSSRPISSHNCLHSADAGVGCEGNIFWKLKYRGTKGQ